jgi:AraC-like DNA-binding protein
VSEITAEGLLSTPVVTIRDVVCRGRHKDQSAEELTQSTHLVFPYRGLFIRHVGRDAAVAEANQVLFFNGHEGYRVSHPVDGGDASLDVQVDDDVLRELAPASLLVDGPPVSFRVQRLRIDPRAQALVALLRHRLRHHTIEPLEADGLALTLVRRAVGARTTHAPSASAARRRIVDRAKVVLASDLARRWTLAEVAAEVGHSPVYLTQIFQQVEGVPLYRYQLRLRLARALQLLPQCEDLTSLGLELGFSSHSHFTTTFTRVYGRSPSSFRRTASGSGTLTH